MRRSYLKSKQHKNYKDPHNRASPLASLSSESVSTFEPSSVSASTFESVSTFIPFQIPETLDSVPQIDDSARISNIKNLLDNKVDERLVTRGNELVSQTSLTNSEKYELSDISFTLLKIGGEMILCRVGDEKRWHNIFLESNRYGKVAHAILH